MLNQDTVILTQRSRGAEGNQINQRLNQINQILLLNQINQKKLNGSSGSIPGSPWFNHAEVQRGNIFLYWQTII